MVCLAAHADSDNRRGVRYRVAPFADDLGHTQCLPIFSAELFHTFRDRADQWWLALAQGFSQADNQKAWIDSLRDLYRFLPFARSTYRRAAAIIAGSSQTYAEFADYRDKLFFVPENGVSRSLCSGAARRCESDSKLELIFVGGLVPYKACDLALRAAAPFLRSDLAHFTVVGGGPERNRLEQLTKSLGIEEAVSFCGMLSSYRSHAAVTVGGRAGVSICSRIRWRRGLRGSGGRRSTSCCGLRRTRRYCSSRSRV